MKAFRIMSVLSNSVRPVSLKLNPNEIFVPTSVKITKLAGKIAALFREFPEDSSESLILKATGTNAVNNAVKAIFVTRKFLIERPGIGLSFRVNHGYQESTERISRLTFLLSQTPGPDTDFAEDYGKPIFVSQYAQSRSLGADIGIALADNERVVIAAIGPPAVGRAVVALTWTRRVLYSTRYDIRVIPIMDQVSSKGRKDLLTGINFFVQRTEYVDVPILDHPVNPEQAEN